MRLWTLVFTLLGLVALSALVWFVAPLIPLGDHAYESVLLRVVTIAALWLIFLMVVLIRWLMRRRRARRLEKEIATGPGDDTPVLRDKLRDALATLKKSSRRGGSAFLYELPWYVIIGPPGSGKTTALVNSGLKFPLSGKGAARAVAGVGGTRHCDWWFTEEAVMIDTAGRYTTQDSDAVRDAKSWTGFLTMLAETRPRQPINGAIVAISIEDLMTLPRQDLDAHASAIRARLDELYRTLKISFPVYVWLTKMDLVAGFMEFFWDLTPEQRQIVWGTTFQPQNKTDNMVAQFGTEYDRLMAALSAQVTDRMQAEPDARARARIFGFPAQMASLQGNVESFLTQIFEPSRYQSDAVLRGVYFTSGTQEGTPIDRVIGALARNFGLRGGAEPLFSGQGKSFFLTDLLRRVIFSEAGWVSTNVKHLRRRFVIRAAMFTLLGVATAAMGAVWWNAYDKNRTLLAQTDRDIDEYRELSANFLREAEIGDGDLAQILQLLQKLRGLKAGYATRDADLPLAEGFGLSQRDRLEAANVEAYRDGLDRLFLPRLIWRLERQLEAKIAEPAFVYEGLKVYLMLGGQARIDRDLVRAWMRRDWERNLYPGAGNAGGRAALLAHLDALMERPSSAVALNGPLVQEAQRTLARMPVAQRAYTLMKTRAEGQGYAPWVASERGGADAELVFETRDGQPLDTVRIDGFYTYRGFHDGVLRQMEGMVQAARSESWVLGEAGDQETFRQQFGTIRRDVLALYRAEFIEAWDAQLARIQIASVGGGRDLTVMSALAAPTSPLKQLLRSVAKETKLTAPPPSSGVAAVDGASAAAAQAEAERQAFASTSSQAGAVGLGIALDTLGANRGAAGEAPLANPGAAIEAHFEQIHRFAEAPEGAEAPVDDLIRRFDSLYDNMNLLRSGLSGQAQSQASQALQADLAALESQLARMPGPVAAMAGGAAAEVKGVALGSSKSQLNQALADLVTRQCTQIVENRYPVFDSPREVPLPDFARLFGPSGIMDRFFQEKLIGMVDLSGDPWRWRTDIDLARGLSNQALRQFQRAAEIRDAFFASGAGPLVSFTVLPVTLSPDAYTVTLDVEGSKLTYDHRAARPTTMTWPGQEAGRSSIRMTPEVAGRRSALAAQGMWSLQRLIDQGDVLRQGDSMTVSFTVGGREASFQISAGSVVNPFNLRALSEFRCPRGF